MINQCICTIPTMQCICTSVVSEKLLLISWWFIVNQHLFVCENILWGSWETHYKDISPGTRLLTSLLPFYDISHGKKIISGIKLQLAIAIKRSSAVTHKWNNLEWMPYNYMFDF